MRRTPSALADSQISVQPAQRSGWPLCDPPSPASPASLVAATWKWAGWSVKSGMPQARSDHESLESDNSLLRQESPSRLLSAPSTRPANIRTPLSVGSLPFWFSSRISAYHIHSPATTQPPSKPTSHPTTAQYARKRLPQVRRRRPVFQDLLKLRSGSSNSSCCSISASANGPATDMFLPSPQSCPN